MSKEGSAMDPVSSLIASAKIPVGRWGKAFFDFLTTNFEWFFDAIANGLTVVLDGLVDALLWFPPFVLVALIALLAWFLQRSVKLAVGIAIGLLFIINQGLEGNGGDAGACGRRRCRFDGDRRAARHLGGAQTAATRIMRPILDLMQTMPPSSTSSRFLSSSDWASRPV
jgi:glycine betaine/proline transport system permease protein